MSLKRLFRLSLKRLFRLSLKRLFRVRYRCLAACWASSVSCAGLGAATSPTTSLRDRSRGDAEAENMSPYQSGAYHEAPLVSQAAWPRMAPWLVALVKG
jgi:hypothetical protein